MSGLQSCTSCFQSFFHSIGKVGFRQTASVQKRKKIERKKKKSQVFAPVPIKKPCLTGIALCNNGDTVYKCKLRGLKAFFFVTDGKFGKSLYNLKFRF